MKNKIRRPYLKTIKILSDGRGSFAELIKQEELNKKTFGQVSITTAKTKQEKGKHFHKIRYEWFIVLEGKILFSVEHIKTHEKKEITLSSSKIQSLCIPPLWIHSFKNTGPENANVLLYSSIPFDPNHTDTYTSTF